MAAPATKLIRVANAAREDPEGCSLFSLWQLADRESGSVPTVRIWLYRHALIHAGVTAVPEGKRPYRICPMCKERL